MTISKWCTSSLLPPPEILMTMSKLLNVELKKLVRLKELEKTKKNNYVQSNMGH